MKSIAEAIFNKDNTEKIKFIKQKIGSIKVDKIFVAGDVDIRLLAYANSISESGLAIIDKETYNENKLDVWDAFNIDVCNGFSALKRNMKKYNIIILNNFLGTLRTALINELIDTISKDTHVFIFEYNALAFLHPMFYFKTYCDDRFLTCAKKGHNFAIGDCKRIWYTVGMLSKLLSNKIDGLIVTKNFQRYRGFTSFNKLVDCDPVLKNLLKNEIWYYGRGM